MANPLAIMVSWVLLMTTPFFVLLATGLCKLYAARKRGFPEDPTVPRPPVEILVPIKGIVPDQEEILLSLVQQAYDSYRVVFILETQEDPANDLVDGLCSRYGRARKIISGISTCCGQKNHNLVEGVLQLKPDTQIIVFCDSTNTAPPDWLRKFTQPIREGRFEAVTSFRTFYPAPQNMAGVSQTIYGTLILLLAIVMPKPWGGATAIRRSTFDRLKVTEIWAKTVVDDLVLGNVLEKNGIKVLMDPCSTLNSPLKNRTIRGFLGYLDRQVLFLKFTNPVIWAGMTVFYINFAVATLLATLSVVLFPFGMAVDGLTSWMCLVFLVALVALALTIRHFLAPHISLSRWCQGVVAFVFLSAFIVIRSIFRRHIDWHGKTYWCTKDGIVLSIGVGTYHNH
jgi:cellulose synthase/poly-beta-1,6-N-acetylglucosamine synthase-like glycosyltransferase